MSDTRASWRTVIVATDDALDEEGKADDDGGADKECDGERRKRKAAWPRPGAGGK